MISSVCEFAWLFCHSSKVRNFARDCSSISAYASVENPSDITDHDP